MHQPSPSADNSSSWAALDLQGSLPCARCAYDLKGLSITSICPECALPVRVTILTRVDPHADELQPLHFPRLTAWGLMLWSFAAAATALFAWLLRTHEAGLAVGLPKTLAWLVPASCALSALGATVMIKPHAVQPAASQHVLGRAAHFGTPLALVGVLLYLPLIWCLYKIFIPPLATTPQSIYKLVALALMALILICLRPNARLLAARSFLMRSGQVDRQQMASLIAVLILLALGEALALGALRGTFLNSDLVLAIARIIILVGAALFTLGLISIAIDVARLRRVITQPPLSLRALVTPPTVP